MGSIRSVGCVLGVLLLALEGCASSSATKSSAPLAPAAEEALAPDAPPIILTQVEPAPVIASNPAEPAASPIPAAPPLGLPALRIRGPLDRPEVHAFIEELARLQHFDRQQLAALFSTIKPRAKVVEAISRPAEAQPWHKYRPRFIQAQRIDQGAAYWRAHSQYFNAAQESFGVPPEIITAIMGVETRYGANAGGFKVVESLVTLGFDYTPRTTFFRKELQEFLLLCREEGWDPRSIKGSYAGAMGLGQFMPSTYRRFALDFDGDGRRDLHKSAADTIGSIAYYLYSHGWGAGAPIVVQVTTQGDAYTRFITRDFKADTPLIEMRENGVTWDEGVVAERGGLFALENTGGIEHWVGFSNFYAITRYNRSVHYSMAVYELAQEILRRRSVQLTESN
ncbi:MAG: lytic murein transglycosylase B [Pseudomonadota bacterium]